ncbi:MAG: Glu/Leu/Phe/Val dehydrogenase dimerization domain-containing protein [Actinocatenispora sp.]
MSSQLRVDVSNPDTRLQAFVVVDSLVGGRAMGGTRMTGTVTMAEVAMLAARMSLKLSWANLPIGGAKAGIVCDRPLGPGRDERFEQFGAAVAPLLKGGVYLGSDQGTTHQDRDRFFAASGYDAANDPAVTALPCTWAKLWEHCEDVTGFGVCEGILAAHQVGPAAGSAGRVVVQGFGAVGRAVAIRLAADGFDVVGVADRIGTVAHPKGLPLPDLLAATDSLGTIDRNALPSGLTFDDRPDAWIDVDADLLVLAAGGNAVHDGNCHRVRARMIAEGGNLSVTPTSNRTLAARGVSVLPDYIVNVGGAAVTALLLTGLAPVCADAKELAAWLYADISERIRENVATLLSHADGVTPLTEIGFALGGRPAPVAVPVVPVPSVLADPAGPLPTADPVPPVEGTLPPAVAVS